VLKRLLVEVIEAVQASVADVELIRVAWKSHGEEAGSRSTEGTHLERVRQLMMVVVPVSA
jgi:hypothetical protein